MPKGRINGANTLWIARKKIGLGQKSVARLLGLQCSSPISEYETGRLLPNLRTALKLSIIYNTPLAELYAPLYGEVTQEVEALRRKLPIAPPINNTTAFYEKDPLTTAYSGH